jgi:hypothetical protein
MKSRRNLSVFYQNAKGLRVRCGLCGKNVQEDGHHPSCAFHDPSVTHVEITQMKAEVTLAPTGMGYEWVSPAGRTYVIKKVALGYRIKERANGTTPLTFHLLKYVRDYIEANQGTL